MLWRHQQQGTDERRDDSDKWAGSTLHLTDQRPRAYVDELDVWTSPSARERKGGWDSEGEPCKACSKPMAGSDRWRYTRSASALSPHSSALAGGAPAPPEPGGIANDTLHETTTPASRVRPVHKAKPVPVIPLGRAPSITRSS